MFVDKRIIDELYQDAGELRVEKAKIYVKTGRTEI